jgi:hypothetical protein
MTVFQGHIAQPHVTVPGRGAVFGKVPLSIRFWSKVKKTKTCWIWIAATNRGRAYMAFNHRPVAAARVSWQMHKGKVKKGLFVLHKCDNPLCVRPSHLFLGTQTDNLADMRRKGRQGIMTFEERSAILNRPETKLKRSLAMKATRWINDGRTNLRLNNNKSLPKGWRYGRLPYKHFSKER